MKNFDPRSLLTTYLLACMLVLFVIPTALRAQVRIDFEPKYKSPTAIRGNFAMLGNTVVELADNPNGGGKVSHNGNGVKFVDVDNDVATINSSAATLVFSNENGAVNSCTQILYAGLYWTGRSSSENNFVDAVLPDGSTIENRFQKDKIKFKKDGSAYEEFTADGVLIPNGDPNEVDNNRGMYVAYTDITDYVTSNRDGIYYAADIATTATGDFGGLGIGYFGGWGLVVVYENPLMKTRHVIVYDGYAFVRGANSPENNFEIEIDEFQSIKSGPVNFTLGVMAGEGDKVDLGDYFGMMNRFTNSYERLQHDDSDINNFFNSSILTQGQRWPDIEDNAGLDIATFDVDNDNNKFIGNNQTTTSFEYGTNGDNYVIFNLTFAVDAYEPEINPLNSLITPIPPSGSFAPGATLDFLLEIRNTGSEEVIDGRIEIPIPNTVTMQVADVSQGQADVTGDVLVWEIGDIAVPQNQSDVVATMRYSVIIDDCEKLVNRVDDCKLPVSINGKLSGKGRLTGEELDAPFIKEYLDGDDECDVAGVPVFGGVDFDIDLSGCFEFTGANDLAVCANEEVEVSFNDGLGTIARYEWSIDNTEIGLEGMGQGDINFVAINTTNQIQTATVTVVPVGLSGCEGTPVSFTITVYPMPNALFEGVGEVCPGSTTIMQAEQSGGTWSSSDESVATVDANGVVTAITPGTTEISYAIVNDNACEAVYSKTITVRDDCLVVSTKEVTDESGDQLAQAGEELFYTIRLSSSFDRAVDRTITDAIPENTTFIEGSITNNGVYDAAANSITWNDVVIPQEGEITVSFAVKVTDNLTGIAKIVNIATVTGDDPDNPEEPEVETPTDPVKSFASTKAADKATVKAGEELTYTITVTNTGNVDYEGITISDAIPANTTYKEGSASPAATLSGGTLSWTVDVPFGESREVNFTVIVDENLTDVTAVRNAAVVTGDDPETPEEPEVETPTDPVKSFASTKAADKATVKAGEELTYTITVTNTGNVDYEGITISDAIPSNTTYKENSASPAATLSGNTLTWTVDVPFGESREVSFTVVVDENLTDVETIRNAAVVTGDDPETPEEPEVETPTDPVKSFASTKTADKTSVKAGEELTYTITVTNTGNVDYEGITISDAIPANTTYKEGSASPAATLSGGTLSWTVDVPFGESREVNFTVIVDENLTDITAIRNAAVVTGDDPETPEEPEVETPTDPVKSFASTKAADKATVKAGEELTYTITVANTGDVDYNGIVIEDAMPSNTTYKENSASPAAGSVDGTLTWAIDVPFGESREVSFTVVVDENLTDVETIRNVAVVTGDDPETPEEPEVETPTDPAKSFSSTKVADKTTVKAGDELTYTITVTNTGNVDYEGITISDAIPANTTYKENSASPATTFSGNTLTWTVDVPFGESREVSFTVVVDENLTDVETIRNAAVVTGDDPETPEEPEVETPTDPAKSFRSTKVADKTTVKAGEELTYTITVANTGDVDYNGIVIEDAMPSNTTYKENSASPAAGSVDGTLTWAIDVPFGESREVSFTVVVDENLTDVETIRNAAVVTGDDPETPEEPEVETPTDPAKSFSSTKVADKTTVKAGEELTYTITVENTGDVDYAGISINDAIPANTTYRENSASPAATLSGNTLAWTVDVPFGESREVSFTVVVDENLTDVETIRNVAVVTGDDPETPEEPEVEVPVDPTVSFEAEKTVNTTVAKAGDEIEYKITVTNTGNTDYEAFRVYDEIPAHTTFVTGSASPSANLDEGALSWVLNIPAGESRSVTFKVKVDDDLTGVSSIRNVAVVEGEDPENPQEPEVEIPVVTGPHANDDEGSTNQNEPVTIEVIANDEEGSSALVSASVRLVDPETGEGLTDLTIPGEGTYTVSADGKVTFTPNEDFVGISTVKYRVSDENGLTSNEATITIIVEGVAAEIAPTAVDDQATTPYRTPVSIPVTSNDVDGSSAIVNGTVTLIDENGNRVKSVTVPEEGTYTVGNDGVITFTPAEGFTGESTIQYEVSDQNGLVSNTATITVTVDSRPFKIPNVFTPNGDGKNDVFEIVGLEGFDRVEITVVNRWGNEVYRNTNYRNNWDGQGLNEGTYYYVIFTHEGGKRDRYTGWVLIKRQ